MQSPSYLSGDLETTLERHGLSARYVVDSAAQLLILPDDIEDATEGFGPVELLLAANDNQWNGRRVLLAM